MCQMDLVSSNSNKGAKMTEDLDILSIIEAISTGGVFDCHLSMVEFTDLMARVSAFFTMLFPPFDSEPGRQWRSQAKDLGRTAIPLLLLWLRDGNSDQQYISQFVLRELCDESWAVGYEPDMYYRVVVGGKTVIVRPQTRTISFESAATDSDTTSEP